MGTWMGPKKEKQEKESREGTQGAGHRKSQDVSSKRKQRYKQKPVMATDPNNTIFKGEYLNGNAFIGTVRCPTLEVPYLYIHGIVGCFELALKIDFDCQ